MQFAREGLALRDLLAVSQVTHISNYCLLSIDDPFCISVYVFFLEFLLFLLFLSCRHTCQSCRLRSKALIHSLVPYYAYGTVYGYTSFLYLAPGPVLRSRAI